MKKLITLLVAFGLALSSFAGHTSTNNASTNSPTIAETAKGTVQTNLNQVLIEMLSGVKDASGEVYGATKEAIHKSVDFVVVQAPDVIHQFLMWKFFYAATWAAIFVVVSIVLVAFSIRLHAYKTKCEKNNDTSSDSYEITCFLKWVTRILSIVILIVGLGANSFEMVKIGIAPKVYVIEYVVDNIQKHQRNHQ